MSDHSVFIIDDDPAVRDALLRVLRGRGVRARGFASGTEFFAALPEDASACVITDVRMPGMGGAEIVRRLADLRETWPVIVITGHADVSMAVEMMKAGIVDFIEKPFDPRRLIETVRGLIFRFRAISLLEAPATRASNTWRSRGVRRARRWRVCWRAC